MESFYNDLVLLVKHYILIAPTRTFYYVKQNERGKLGARKIGLIGSRCRELHSTKGCAWRLPVPAGTASTCPSPAGFPDNKFGIEEHDAWFYFAGSLLNQTKQQAGSFLADLDKVLIYGTKSNAQIATVSVIADSD